MNEKQEVIIVVVILVIAIIMLPVSLAVLTHSTNPYYIIQENPIEIAAEKAGLSICSETEIAWNIPGLTKGMTYTIADNCENPTEMIIIDVLSFDSSESRDAAILAYHSNTIGKNSLHGNLIVLGQYLIYINYSGSSLLDKISEELGKF
jgi:hypothetical protein